MLKFEKDDQVKLIDPDSSLIPVLKEQGWKEQKKKKDDK